MYGSELGESSRVLLEPFILFTAFLFQLLRELWECPHVILTWLEEKIPQFVGRSSVNTG